MRANARASIGITESRLCATSGELRERGSAFTAASDTGSRSGATGARSTASQRSSSAVGSGYAARTTSATPTTSLLSPL